MNSLSSHKQITFSPSWTLIPTHYCRNTCGYCVFVEREGPRAELLSLQQAQHDIKRAQQAGATELLIMSGEGVETSARVREQLRQYNFTSYLDYLLHLSQLALSCEILPHINVGNISETQFRALRQFVPSLGMMIETTNQNLIKTDVHRCAPDKLPQRRLETLEAAGRARVPFTTGLLIGIGETQADWLESLQAIKDIHQKYGHIQEVIIQPFTPHQGTAMQVTTPPTLQTMLEAVELARRILPAEVAVQIPPNLAPQFVDLIEAGASDLGGISPDGDRINPDERWREPYWYAAALATHGYSLRARLAVHDHYLSREWLSPETCNVADKIKSRPSIPGRKESQTAQATR